MKSFWKRHTDKVGVVGAILAAICCLGFPALLSILSAIGLGFLINDAVLLPLLIVFLLVTLLGLALGMREHHRASALLIGIASAAGVFIFIFIAFNKVLAAISVNGLVIETIINVQLRLRDWFLFLMFLRRLVHVFLFIFVHI